MISGMVNTEREATVRLTLIGRSGGQVRVEAVIDTGYDGWLVLSPALITELGYAWTNECNAILADGRM